MVRFEISPHSVSKGLPHTSHTLAVRTPSNTTGANMLHAGSYVGWRCHAAMCHAAMRERLEGTYVRSCRDVRGAVRSPVRRAARHNFQRGYSRAHSIPGKAVRAHRVASKWDGDGCAPTRRLGSDQSAVSPPRLSSTPSADFPLSAMCERRVNGGRVPGFFKRCTRRAHPIAAGSKSIAPAGLSPARFDWVGPNIAY